MTKHVAKYIKMSDKGIISALEAYARIMSMSGQDRGWATEAEVITWIIG